MQQNLNENMRQILQKVTQIMIVQNPSSLTPSPFELGAAQKVVFLSTQGVAHHQSIHLLQGMRQDQEGRVKIQRNQGLGGLAKPEWQNWWSVRGG